VAGYSGSADTWCCMGTMHLDKVFLQEMSRTPLADQAGAVNRNKLYVPLFWTVQYSWCLFQHQSLHTHMKSWTNVKQQKQEMSLCIKPE
jgi:hypothetical protein